MLALPKKSKVTDRPTRAFTYVVANDLIFWERIDINTTSQWSAEAQTATGPSPKGAIYTSPGGRRYGDRLLLAVSPQPWVRTKKK